MGPGVQLPYQPPSWLRPEEIAKATAAIGGAVVAGEWMAEVRVDLPLQLMVIVFVALWAAGTVHLATRRGSSRADAVGGMLCWFPLGAAVCAVVLGVVAAVYDPYGRGLEDLLLSPIAGPLVSPLALPLGLVAASGRSRPHHEAPVLALLGGGLWLLGVAALFLIADRAASLAVLVPGAAMVAAGAAWTGLRARFMRRVRTGRAPGFVIVESEGGAVESGLLPYRPLRRVCIVDTLAAVVPDTAGVYRGAQRPIPVCLVQRLPH